MHRLDDDSRRVSRGASLLTVVCMACVWCAPTDAFAKKTCVEKLSESEKDTFNVFLSAGRNAFEQKRYDKALMSFEQAYYICPIPKLLFLIGECHEKLNHASEAIEYYRKFLDEKADTDKREEIEARIARLETLGETMLTIKTLPEGAKVLIDGQFQGISPQTIVVAREQIELAVELQGHEPIVQKIELDAGVQKELFFTLRPTQDVEVVEPSRAGLSPLQRTGVAFWIVGGVAVVGGGTLASVGLVQRRDLEAIDRSTRTRGDYNTRYEAANRRLTFGAGAFGVGAVLVGVGTYLYLSEEKKDEKARAVSLDLHPGRDGAALELKLTF